MRGVEKWAIQTFWPHFCGVLLVFVFQPLSDSFFKTLSFFFRFGNADCAKDKHNTKAVAVAPGGHQCLGIVHLLCNLLQATLNEVLCRIWPSGLDLKRGVEAFCGCTDESVGMRVLCLKSEHSERGCRPQRTFKVRILKKKKKVRIPKIMENS